MESDNNWREEDILYCGHTCKYVDSVGFCEISHDIRFSIGVPNDAKCRNNIIEGSTRPEGAVPEKYNKYKLEKIYGFK